MLHLTSYPSSLSSSQLLLACHIFLLWAKHSVTIRGRHSPQMTISGLFDFGHIITEAVIVRGKQVKQRVMYRRWLSDQRQLTFVTVNGDRWPVGNLNQRKS